MENVIFELSLKYEITSWIKTLKPSPAIGLLLSGDRLACVTEAIVAKINNQIVGVATIASKGEYIGDEQPSIIAIYVLPEHRGKGIGSSLLKEAIDYLTQKGAENIKIDVLNSKILRMIDHLPIEKKSKLNVIDHSMGGIVDEILER